MWIRGFKNSKPNSGLTEGFEKFTYQSNFSSKDKKGAKRKGTNETEKEKKVATIS